SRRRRRSTLRSPEGRGVARLSPPFTPAGQADRVRAAESPAPIQLRAQRPGSLPMKINGNAIRPGMVIEHESRLWRAVKIQHTQPGKGGAYLQVELKDIRDGTKLNERFRSSETVERVRLDEKDYQFLFVDGDHYTFMDTETFEQITLDGDLIG